MTNSHQKQASRDAHTMFGVCWLHLLFMIVVLFDAVVPRSLVVVMIVVVVVVVQMQMHFICAVRYHSTKIGRRLGKIGEASAIECSD